jgi:hypothetical protein
MAKRIYAESIKKWAIKVGIPAGSVGALGILIFAYLSSIGAIEVLGYSEDMVCAGTIEDPCYAYINFTAKEDIFIYPIDYDPWGRETPFEFEPNVKSWKLQRSWGSGWRDIPLNQSCTGTWCGLSDSSDTRKFSVAFREGRTYEIRIVAYKHDPYETIKWTAFEIIDPYWEGISPFEYDCIETTERKVITGYKEVEYESINTRCDTWDLKEDSKGCVFDIEANHTYYNEKNCSQCYDTLNIDKVMTPIYETEQICEPKNRKGVWIYGKKYVNFTELGVTGEVKDGVLTMKDLSRGGSWKDHNMNECYNKGVPCIQIKIESKEKISVEKSIADNDREFIKQEEKKKMLFTNELSNEK